MALPTDHYYPQLPQLLGINFRNEMCWDFLEYHHERTNQDGAYQLNIQRLGQIWLRQFTSFFKTENTLCNQLRITYVVIKPVLPKSIPMPINL